MLSYWLTNVLRKACKGPNWMAGFLIHVIVLMLLCIQTTAIMTLWGDIYLVLKYNLIDTKILNRTITMILPFYTTLFLSCAGHSCQPALFLRKTPSFRTNLPLRNISPSGRHKSPSFTSSSHLTQIFLFTWTYNHTFFLYSSYAVSDFFLQFFLGSCTHSDD